MAMGRAFTAAISGPRREVRRKELAPSAPTRWVPVTVVESVKVAVTDVGVVEIEHNFFEYCESQSRKY
jgi:hypothetical protein